MKYLEELFYILEMKSCGRLIKYIYSLAGRSFRELCCEFNPLSFSSWESRWWLSELDIVESHILKHFEYLGYLWMIRKEIMCFFHCEAENISNSFSFVFYFECFWVESSPSTWFTVCIYGWKKVHFYLFYSISFTFLTSPRFCIETKSPRSISSEFCIIAFSKHFSDMCKYSCIGSWITSGCFSDRGLIYGKHLIKSLYSCYFFKLYWEYLPDSLKVYRW